MDSTKEDQVNYGTLCRLTTELSNSPEFSFVGKLNSMARQASAERAWFSISRFYDNCQRGLAKKGYPKFKKFWFFVTWYGSIGGHKWTKSLSGKRFN
jgi:putative transposase